MASDARLCIFFDQIDHFSMIFLIQIYAPTLESPTAHCCGSDTIAINQPVTQIRARSPPQKVVWGAIALLSLVPVDKFLLADLED
jgi:hypothetical protein